MLGYEHGFSHQVKDLVDGIADGTDPHPTFAEGLQVQRVLAAIEQSSADDSALGAGRRRRDGAHRIAAGARGSRWVSSGVAV